jgi:5-(carboxyamino)imidazole ribonucleotide synthase
MKALLPPAVIGIIGGGQLGMMTIREAQRMGYRTVVWDPNPECPASRLADEVIAAPFNDLNAATIFGDNVDVATYEFENIDSVAVEKVERAVAVYPGSQFLRIAQHRREEKAELAKRGFPVVPHRAAGNKEEVGHACAELGFPVVVKTSTSGYDGKGQTVLNSDEQSKGFLQQLGEEPKEYVVEKFLDLQCELSCVAVRNSEGTVAVFPISENTHRNNILHRTIVPARVSSGLMSGARELGKRIIESFQLVGVLCVEMFVTRDGSLLVNELAPRPHNSGHYSLDACSYSQFEALIRTVSGLPIPAPELLAPCGMVNLLGKHLEKLDVATLSGWGGVKLHLYGKKQSGPNRKMGHITVVGGSIQDVDSKVAMVERMIGEDRS